MKKTYSEATLRRRAKRLGYVLVKGFQRHGDGRVYHDNYLERHTGYSILDWQTSFIVYGYNGFITNVLDLTDVEEFLKEEYEKYGMQW